ncbi:MAG TPA: manganese efflux pump MntP family protein [Lentimicrobium sp.]|nr:manganese efflux pump MntP family protein [Lentimicrobium sp.]
MDYVSIFFLAFGLSMDSFAVSITSGLRLPDIKFGSATIIAFSLAFFQGLLPFVGWMLGLSVMSYFRPIDHWIAFVLLAFLGVKMVIDSFKEEEDRQFSNPLNPGVLLTMSIATSIDALIVGMTLAFIDVTQEYYWLSILIPVLIIGSVTFIMSMLGILFGKKVGSKFGKKMEMLGGIVLFVIGARILIEHLIK